MNWSSLCFIYLFCIVGLVSSFELSGLLLVAVVGPALCSSPGESMRRAALQGPLREGESPGIFGAEPAGCPCRAAGFTAGLRW